MTQTFSIGPLTAGALALACTSVVTPVRPAPPRALETQRVTIVGTLQAPVGSAALPADQNSSPIGASA